MRYALIFLILTVNFAIADDENFIRKAAKHYNLPPLSDYLQDANGSDPHSEWCEKYHYELTYSECADVAGWQS